MVCFHHHLLCLPCYVSTQESDSKQPPTGAGEDPQPSQILVSGESAITMFEPLQFPSTLHCYPFLCQVLKLYAWEPSFDKRVSQIRMQEIAYLLKIAILYLCTGLCWNIAPFLVNCLASGSLSLC